MRVRTEQPRSSFINTPPLMNSNEDVFLWSFHLYEPTPVTRCAQFNPPLLNQPRIRPGYASRVHVDDSFYNRFVAASTPRPSVRVVKRTVASGG